MTEDSAVKEFARIGKTVVQSANPENPPARWRDPLLSMLLGFFWSARFVLTFGALLLAAVYLFSAVDYLAFAIVAPLLGVSNTVSQGEYQGDQGTVRSVGGP